MATTIAQRITSTVSDASVKRVAYNDASAGPTSDPWNGSWGNSWGNSWKIVTSGVSASPSIGVTTRIGSAPTENTTKRVTGL